MSKISEQKFKQHSEFLERIIRDSLVRNLGVYKDNPPGNIRYWREYVFTADGILNKAGLFKIVASPDLIFYTENPAFLIFLEAKPVYSILSKAEMKRQLLEYHDYVAYNPEFLIDFLEENRIPEAIDVVTIGFCGVTATRRGLREQVYFPLFQIEQAIADYTTETIGI